MKEQRIGKKRMNGKLKKHNALVTGGSRGIGRGIAEALARHGANVAITAMNELPVDISDGIMEKYGVFVKPYIMDVRDCASVCETVANIEKDFGSIDLLSANAGICQPYPFLGENSIENLRSQFATNVDGVWNSIYYVAKSMVEKGVSGRIVVTGSVTGDVVADSGEAGYATTKAALGGLVRALASEFACHDIGINLICPGIVHTRLIDELAYSMRPNNPNEIIDLIERGIPLRRMGRASDIGELAAFLLCKEESGYITGSKIVIDGGSTLPEMPFLCEA